MPVLSWDNPVDVHMPHSGRQTVHGPFAALILLMDEWPNMSGLAYPQARTGCRAALDGRTSTETAREKFMAVAREAEVLLIPQLNVA